MKKTTLIAATAISIATIGGGLSTAALASAQSATTPKTSHSRHEKRMDGRIRLDARLTQAVRDGTITEVQKTAFLNELKTVKAERTASNKTATTPSERQAERAKVKTEIQAWATSTNFPLAKVAPHMAS